MTVTVESPLLLFTVASVTRQNFVKKVPRLLVFVKTLSMEDECASATIKDPTGTRAAARCPCALARCRTPAVPSALETLRGDMAYVNPNR